MKLTGADVKALYSDNVYWPDSVYVDDEVVSVNGQELETGALAPEGLADTDVVDIKGGYLSHETDEHHPLHGKSFQTFIRTWLKQKTATRVLVEIQNEHLDAFKAQARNLGFKIIA